MCATVSLISASRPDKAINSAAINSAAINNVQSVPSIRANLEHTEMLELVLICLLLIADEKRHRGPDRRATSN